MGVAGGNSKVQDGAAIITWTCNGSQDQTWVLALVDPNSPNGPYFIENSVATSECLSVAAKSKSKDAQLVLWHCKAASDNQDQRWLFSSDRQAPYVYIGNENSGLDATALNVGNGAWVGQEPQGNTWFPNDAWLSVTLLRLTPTPLTALPARQSVDRSQQMKKRTAIRLGGVAVAGLIFTAVLPAPFAAADIGGGLPGITENGSDPMVTKCTFNGQAGFCMVTSQDIGMGATTAVPYPMNITKGYFSPDGLNWTDEGRVVAPHTNKSIFEEDKLFTNQPNGFVPPGTNHLWAPDLVAGPNGTWRLYEPDIFDNSVAGSHTSSEIMMSTSNSPFGPFTTQHLISFSEGGNAAYASDPEVVTDNGLQDLFWVNGDLQSCGEFMSAPMQSDGFTISGRETGAVEIDGIPSFYGSCHRSNTAWPYAADYPYMEGPSVFKTSDLAPDLTGLPGPYIMLIPMKPNSNPPECQVFGQPGGNLSVIAYATAPSMRGPYTYQRILMCGSSTRVDQPGVPGRGHHLDRQQADRPVLPRRHARQRKSEPADPRRMPLVRRWHLRHGQPHQHRLRRLHGRR